MQEKIDYRLSWLTQHLGGTGDKLAIITTCLLHAGYFLLATLCILFLNAPLFTRLVLLILVPINAWSEIKFRSSLSYGSLSCLLTLALIGKYFFVLSVSSIKLFKEFFICLRFPALLRVRGVRIAAISNFPAPLQRLQISLPLLPIRTGTPIYRVRP